jgi:hypothetical protein
MIIINLWKRYSITCYYCLIGLAVLRNVYYQPRTGNSTSDVALRLCLHLPDASPIHADVTFKSRLPNERHSRRCTTQNDPSVVPVQVQVNIDWNTVEYGRDSFRT